MADGEESEELVMIAEKARALLSRAERQVLGGYCSSYLAGAMSVQRFVDALQRLLPTPDKATFLVELRELVRDEDTSEYDNRAFALKRPFRPVQFQSDNSLDFEMRDDCPSRCLLQVERRYSDHSHLYSNPIAFSEMHAAKPTIPQIYRRPRFRSGLQETKVPIMTPDMASAFPVAAPNAFDAKTADRSPARQATPPPKPIQKSRLPVSDDGLIEVVVPKTKNILGIAIEGGVDTRHHLPRIISIDGKGTAFEAAGLRIGQTIIQVDGTRMEGLSHKEAAQFIATSYADRTVPEMKFILSACTFRPNANYQPEN